MLLLHDVILQKALRQAGAPIVLQEVAEEVEEDVEEVAKQASTPFKSFFGGGGRAKAAEEVEEEVEEVATQASKPFKSFFGGGGRAKASEIEEEVHLIIVPKIVHFGARTVLSIFAIRLLYLAAPSNSDFPLCTKSWATRQRPGSACSSQRTQVLLSAAAGGGRCSAGRQAIPVAVRWQAEASQGRSPLLKPKPFTPNGVMQTACSAAPVAPSRLTGI